MSPVFRYHDFGPIRSGKIEVGDLTVLIGPNNTGKSVAAIAIYAALKAASPGKIFTFYRSGLQRRGNRIKLPAPGDERTDEVAEALRPIIESTSAGRTPSRARFPSFVTEYFQQYLDQALEIYSAAVADELERCFGTPLPSLARRRGKSAEGKFVIRSEDPTWSVTVSTKAGATVTRRVEARRVLVTALAVLTSPDTNLEPFDVGDLVWASVWVLLTELTSEPEYLPAERSGILQSHRVLATTMLRQAPYAGLERFDIPQLSGVITDFLSNLIEVGSPESNRRTDHEPYQDAATALESNVLGGSVRVRGKEQGYPEISYRQGRRRFALHRVSSMVTEIAPLVIYLRHLLKPGQFLVIEEPESHLHPQHQVQVANLVATLAEHGLSLLVTTHSDYFLSRLNNSIRASNIKARTASTETDAKPLAADRIRAYVFCPASAAGPTTIRDLEVSAEHGISEEEFGRVAAQIYDETVELEEMQLTR